MPRITPCLWFDDQAEEAATFYASVFPNSKVLDVSHYSEAGPGPAGSAMMVRFVLDGQELLGLNGGPAHYAFSEAVSFMVGCRTQEEVDHFWSRLTEGGEEGPCGWLKDRFGLSWQVVPDRLGEIMSDPDPERAKRAMAAMLTMKKLDVATLERAAEGSP